MGDRALAAAAPAQRMTDEQPPARHGDGHQPSVRWPAIVTPVLCMIGLGLSLYTLWVHYHPGALACIDAGPVDCQAVLTSPQSVVAGIPVPYFGVLFFVALGVVCLPTSWRSANPWVRRGRLTIASVGIGAVLYLVATELFTVQKICLWCTGVHVVTFALFIIIVTNAAAVRDRSEPQA